MHFLVAYDGSHDAEQAALLAARIADALGAGVTVLGVAPREHGASRLRRQLEDLAARLQTPTLTPSVTTASGHVTSRILREVETGAYDLLAVGSHGEGLSRFLLGATSLQLVRQAPVPVLVVRRAPPDIRRILVCTGGEPPHGVDSFALAVEIAAASGAAVEVLHVMSQHPLATGTGLEGVGLDRTAEWHVDHGTSEGRHLAAVVDHFVAREVAAEAKIRHGLVVDEIVEEARSQPADLVVVGAHGEKGMLQFLLDDITEHVIDRLDRPVLVVRAPRAEDPSG